MQFHIDTTCFIAGGDARTNSIPYDEGSAPATATAIATRRRIPAALRPLPRAEDREEVQALRQGARVQAAPVRGPGGPREGGGLQGK